MLETSLSALFLSVLPFGLHGVGLSEPTTWSVTSALLALFLIVEDIAFFRRAAPLRSESPRVIQWTTWILILGDAVVVILQSYNSVFSRQPGPLVLGLVWLLGESAYLFARLLGFGVHDRPTT